MKRITGIILFGSLLFFVLFIQSAAATINVAGSLFPDEFRIQTFESNNVTDNNIGIESNKWINWQPGKNQIEFDASGELSIYLVNETEMANWVNKASFTSKKAWINITSLNNVQLSYDVLTSEAYGFEPTIRESVNDTRTYAIVIVYIIIVNEGIEEVKYSFQFDQINEFILFLEDFFRLLLIIAFFTFGILLLWDFKQTKEENKIRAEIYLNYGIGLIIAGIAVASWKVYHWYRMLNPSDVWVQVFVWKTAPENFLFSSTIFTFFTFLALGFSIIFISYTVEINVQQRKKPIMTIILFAMEILIIFGTIFTQIINILIYIWIVVLIFTGLNIVYTYIVLIKKSTGIVRKKAIFTIIGISLVFAFIGLREFIIPEFICNATGFVSMFLFYAGLKME